MICPHCRQAHLQRRKRTWAERLFLAAVFRCPACGRESSVSRTRVLPLLSLTARCPKCGSAHLDRLRHPDPIDPLYGNPLSRVQQWLGAPLLYCSPCRLQFFDYRPRIRSDKDGPKCDS
jgi:transcription elongation factor Elf1